MANSLYVNKVEFGNQTVIDLTGDTVTAADVRHGVSFHLPSGAAGIGTAVNGYTIYMNTTSPEFYGQTITVSQNGSVIGTTSFDNQGNAQYSVDNVGTYTVSVTASGTTVSEEVVVSQIEIELEAGFQYKRWLGYTSLDPDDYASLAAVLADEKAVRQLMTVHASVDYLASFTSDDTSVVTILNNDLAAKWITCTAYAEDVLTDAYSTLMESIGKYGYGEWGITDATTTPPTWGALGNVPIMTSNNAPYGEASQSSAYDSSGNYNAWKAFCGIADEAWYSSQSEAATNNWIQYKFPTPICFKRVKADNLLGHANGQWAVVGSNDGATWSASLATIEFTNSSQSVRHEIKEADSNNEDYYLYLRFKRLSKPVSTPYVGIIGSLQFYGRQMSVSVPKMTSNTAPYGEASANAEYTADYAAWKAFMNDPAVSKSWSPASTSGTTPNTGWIKYDFGSKVKLGFVLIFTRSANSWTGSIEGYDGEDWETIHTISTPQTGNNYPSISTSHIYAAPVVTEKVYTAFRFTSTSFRVGGTGSGYAEPDVNMVQFYGFDYSEKEWDTAYPRHYIYDHGVELEEIEQVTAANGWSLSGYTFDGLGVKNPSDLYLPATSSSHGNGFGVKTAFDFSDYSLLFVRADSSGNTSAGSYSRYRTAIAKNLGNNLGDLMLRSGQDVWAIDVSNVNQAITPAIIGIAVAEIKCYIHEWWLE